MRVKYEIVMDFYRKVEEHYTFYIRGINSMVEARWNACQVIFVSSEVENPLFTLVTKTPQLIPDFLIPAWSMRAGWDSHYLLLQDYFLKICYSIIGLWP